jgi:Ca-activated chloride channel family protein
MPEIDCQQTTLLVPIGTGNRRSIIEKIRQIHPYGVTPLTRALMEAGRDLSPLSGKKHVILISDGAETCGGNPCEYVRRLIAMGIKIKIDIVSMGLKRDKEARSQLNCVAAASGGKYYDSNTSAELVDNLSRTVNTALSGRVITKPSAATIKTGGTSTEAEKQINQMFSDK